MENMCEEIHFLVNRQAGGMQSPSQAFLWILTAGLQGNFYEHYFSEHFLEHLQWLFVA